MSANRQRQTAETAKTLPLEERKALVQEWANTATGAAKKGAHLIDVRDVQPDEKARAERLGPRAKEILTRNRERRAA